MTGGVGESDVEKIENRILSHVSSRYLIWFTVSLLKISKLLDFFFHFLGYIEEVKEEREKRT